MDHLLRIAREFSVGQFVVCVYPDDPQPRNGILECGKRYQVRIFLTADQVRTESPESEKNYKELIGGMVELEEFPGSLRFYAARFEAIPVAKSDAVDGPQPQPSENGHVEGTA